MLRHAAILAILTLLSCTGCNDSTSPRQNAGDHGVHGQISMDTGGFKVVFETAGTSEYPLQGPFVLRGYNLHYDDSLAVLQAELTVTNEGEHSYAEPARLRFARFLPGTVRVLNSDNGLEGPGAELEFQFENDDAMWTPGEISLPRFVQFLVDADVSIAFVAQLQLGGASEGGHIAGTVWNDLDADGHRDAGEPGIAYSEVILESAGPDSSAHAQRVTLTADDGSFQFSGLASGSYVVGASSIAGWSATTESLLHVLLVERNGVVADFHDADFGFAFVHSSVWWGGPGSGAGEFDYPCALAVDDGGAVYVADVDNHRIQKFSSQGEYILEWGGWGTLAGEFQRPCGVEVDASGKVYVADLGNHRIQKFSPTGDFLMAFGTRGSGAGQFERPRDVAVDRNNNIYVVESDGNRVQKFNSAGTHVLMWGRAGAGAGEFSDPKGIAVDSQHSVYVSDDGNYRVQKFTASGAYLLQWGSAGTGPGEFYSPLGIDVGPDQTVYVIDPFNHRVQRFNAAGQYLGAWGEWGSAPGQLDTPYDVAIGPTGQVFVAEAGNHRVQRFSALGFAKGLAP